MKHIQPTDLFALGRGAATFKATFSDFNQLVPYQANAPTDPQTGAQWRNSENGILYTFNGKVWIGK